jgi:SAM-dependent methyltransferase
MSQLDLILNRTIPAGPWVEGENIPWNEPAFSARMLREHLDQSHDRASRRSAVIDDQVEFIHTRILDSSPARILDLACGPGLYVRRLTDLGHSCVGIDFSPAAVAHARKSTPGAEFIEGDLRSATFPGEFDLVMMLYGQINVFRRAEAADIIARALATLTPGGHLLLEAQSADHVRTTGQEPPTWTTQSTGLFSSRPHILLTESFWDERSRTATERFYVIDIETTAVTRYAMSNEAYTEQEYAELLSGYEEIQTTVHEPGWTKGDGLTLVVGDRPC